MSNLTKEEWKEFEESIALFSSAKVLIDGIPFSFTEERSNNKIVIVFFICGRLMGKWTTGESNYKKYFRTTSRSLFTKKEMDKQYRFYKKYYGKKQAEERLGKMKYEVTHLSFSSFRTLKSHLVKNGFELELVRDAERFAELSKEYRAKHPEDFKVEDPKTNA